MKNMSSLVIQSPVDEGVLKLTLNRPSVMNALNTKMLVELSERVCLAAENSEVRAVVITGNERAFAAGADIDELKQVSQGTFPEDERQQAWALLRNFPKPIIAAVNGYALGGGCELMMVADIVVAARTALFGQPEVKLGIMSGAGGTQVLTRLVGRAAAMRMNLTGHMISAQEAQALGLVSEVVEPEVTVETALELAKVTAEHSSLATQAIKSAVLSCSEMSLSEGLLAERSLFLKLANGEDAQEGINAFLEKRKPEYGSAK